MCQREHKHIFTFDAITQPRHYLGWIMLVTGAPDRCNIIGVHRVIGVNIYIMGLYPCSLMAMQVLQWLPYELLEQ